MRKWQSSPFQWLQQKKMTPFNLLNTCFKKRCVLLHLIWLFLSSFGWVEHIRPKRLHGSIWNSLTSRRRTRKIEHATFLSENVVSSCTFANIFYPTTTSCLYFYTYSKSDIDYLSRSSATLKNANWLCPNKFATSVGCTCVRDLIVYIGMTIKRYVGYLSFRKCIATAIARVL